MKISDIKHIIRPVIILLAILSGSLFTTYSQVQVYPVEDIQSFTGKMGVFYTLPMTCLKIDVKVKKIQYFKGPYSEYAYRFLGLDDPIIENSVHYELSDVCLDSFIVPDPEQMFFIEFTPKQAKEERNLMFSLSESGMLIENAINIDWESSIPQDVDIEEVFKKEKEKIKKPDDLFKYYATTNLVEKIDTIVRRIFLDTTIIEDISYERSMIYKTLEQRATEAAAFIEEIRNNRFDLITGYQEVNYDKEAIKYMDSQIMELEEAYLSLFKGVVVEDELSFSFINIPDRAAEGISVILFRFSADDGVINALDASGDPVTISSEKIGLFSQSENYNIFEQSTSIEQGFYYRIPANVKMTVSMNNQVLNHKILPVNQLGASSLIPVMDNIHLQFWPESGLIKKVELE